MTLPQGPNQRWRLDFVSDTLVCSRRIRILAVVDDFTRENLALVVDTSLSGARVARELDAIIAVRGKGCVTISGARALMQQFTPLPVQRNEFLVAPMWLLARNRRLAARWIPN